MTGTTQDQCEAVNAQITDIVLERPVTRGWLGGFAIAFALLMLLNVSIGWLVVPGSMTKLTSSTGCGAGDRERFLREALTIGAADLDLGSWNFPLAMAFSAAKAVLIGAIFMHLRGAQPLTRVFALAGFFWLLILLALALSDNATRPNDPSPRNFSGPPQAMGR